MPLRYHRNLCIQISRHFSLELSTGSLKRDIRAELYVQMYTMTVSYLN